MSQQWTERKKCLVIIILRCLRRTDCRPLTHSFLKFHIERENPLCKHSLKYPCGENFLNMKRKTIHKDFKFLSNLFVTSASPDPQHTLSSLSPFPCFLLSFSLYSSESFKSIGSCHSVQNPPLASYFTQNKNHSFYKAFQYRTPPSPHLPHCFSDLIHYCSSSLP